MSLIEISSVFIIVKVWQIFEYYGQTIVKVVKPGLICDY